MNSLLAAMLNGWWQGIVLTLLVWLVLRELRWISAATKAGIWQTTLIVVLLLPALQRIPYPASRQDVRPNQTAAPVHALAATPLQTAPVLPAPPHPVIELTSHDGPAIFAGVAVVLACFQLIRLLIGYCAVRRLKRKAAPLAIALPCAGSRSIDVLSSARIGMPMATGYRKPAILLPENLVEQLNPEQLRYVLLHETAHLNRYDDWLALGERVLRAIFCFQPAVHFIGRQINQEREMACDDWVIAKSGQTKAYASALARLAELASSGSVPSLAMGAGRRQQIFARLDALLDRARNRVPAVSATAVIIAGLILTMTVFQGARFSHLLGFSEYSTRWVESDGVRRREVKMRGDIEFAPNDQDVQTMSPGAKLVLEQSDEFRAWRIEFEPDADGAVQRRYFSGFAQRPFDAEARRLLASTLPGWVRELGRDIPERLSREVRESGVDATLEGIRTIRGNGVKRAYLEELLRQPQLSATQLSRALKIAGGMDSDEDKRHFVESLHSVYAERGPADASLLRSLDLAVLGCIDSIHSDDDREHLLRAFVEQGRLDALTLARLSRSVSQMSSDEAKAQVLLRASETTDAVLPEAFFDAVAGIHSDEDRERVLLSVLAAHGGHPATVAAVLRSAAAMTAENQKANVMVAASGFPSNAATLQAASLLLTSMHEDGERHRAVDALIAGDGNPDTLREVLAQTARMSSDEDKSQVLLKVAAKPMGQEAVRRLFFTALNTIHSSGEQRQVLLAVLARTDLTPDLLHELSQAALRISGVEEQAAVLRAIAERS